MCEWASNLVMHPGGIKITLRLKPKPAADARVLEPGRQAAGEGEKSVSSRIALLEGDNSWLRIQVEELASQKGQVWPAVVPCLTRPATPSLRPSF